MARLYDISRYIQNQNITLHYRTALSLNYGVRCKVHIFGEQKRLKSKKTKKIVN